MRSYHFGQSHQYGGQAFTVILFVYISDIVPLLPFGFGIANVVNVEAERFCKVIETVESKLVFHSFYLPIALKNKILRLPLVVFFDYLTKNAQNPINGFERI